MRFRHFTCLTALTTAFLAPIGAQAFDDAKYPDLKGEWRRVAVPSGVYRGVQYDPHKPAGPGQEAPLTPEYQAIFEANLKDQAAGGEILVPEAVRHMLSGKSYVYADRGETLLKGFEDKVRLYEVRWSE